MEKGSGSDNGVDEVTKGFEVEVDDIIQTNWNNSESWDLKAEKKNYVLSIVIPVYNNINFTKNCLNDLVKLPSTHEIVVVDNANQLELADFMFELEQSKPVNSAALVYIGNYKNLGFGRACNKGYHESRGKNVLFLNNDIRVKNHESDWTKELIAAAESGVLAAANGGLLDRDFNFIRETDSFVDDPGFYLSGWCLAGSRETFDKLRLNHYMNEDGEIVEGRARGIFDERFWLYYEETSMCFTAKKLGIQMKVVPVPVYHFGKATTKKMNISELYKTSLELFRSIWAPK